MANDGVVKLPFRFICGGNSSSYDDDDDDDDDDEQSHAVKCDTHEQ